MLKGFKSFLMRGNIVEMAVAVVIGVSFTSLVATFTKALIQPLINIFLGGGMEGGTFVLRGQRFDIGAVFTALITFVITAAVVYFLVVMPLEHLEERRRRGEPVATPEPSNDIVLLAEIRDLLRSQARE